MDLSRKAMLVDLVGKVHAVEPKFVTWRRYTGFFSNVHVFVFDLEIPVKLNEVFVSSGVEFETTEKVEERAAEAMIRKLERDYKFEAVDLNWLRMRHFNMEGCNSCAGWRQAQKEIEELKIKVDALTKGWRRTLEELGYGCNLGPFEGIFCPMDYVQATFYEGISEFERIAERY
jgi:hypothetical protein